MIKKNIIAKLSSQFKPTHLAVIDESYRHNVPGGTQSHFKIIIVSDHFEDLRLLSRHQAIYKALATELAEGVHALALHTYTQQEWAVLPDKQLVSPVCQGQKGSK